MNRTVPLLLALAGLGACSKPNTVPTPTTTPLQRFPTQALVGAQVAVFPLNFVTYDSTLSLDSVFVSGRGRQRVDSILAAALRQFGWEVRWVMPDSLRLAARKAPGLLANPDDLATSRLRVYTLQTVPEPLRAQLRTLTGAVTGGRHALVPAGLDISRQPDGRYVADFSIALADVRVGAVGWSNTLRGVGDDVWTAVTSATRLLFP
jgi:hypothetical protein